MAFFSALPNHDQIIFRVFPAKIACQAPNPSNPLPTNNIRLAC
jgi:hypothetical protein